MICAIVDAYRIANNIAPELLRYGVRCVHVESGLHEEQEFYKPQDFVAEIKHEGDVSVTAAALRDAGAGIVVAGNESGVLLADELSAELGTPGNGMSRPRARRDKYEMVSAVADAGLRTAASFASPDADAIVAWASGKPWPAVLKPVTSAGGDNVYICRTAGEIRSAHARIMAGADLWGSRNETVLAQQFLAGDEYFVNTVSRDGVHHLVEVWRYQKRQMPAGQICYDYEYPVPPDEPVVAELTGYTRGVLDALEVRNAAAHTEIIVLPDGPVLVECGARLGGAHVPALLKRVLGTTQVEQLATAIARPELVTAGRLPAYRLLTHTRYVTLISPYAGSAPTEERMAPVRALKSCTEMVLYLPAGTPFGPTVDLLSAVGHLYLCSDDPAQLEADYQAIRQLEEAGLYA
jgi:biotin carboxylase